MAKKRRRQEGEGAAEEAANPVPPAAGDDEAAAAHTGGANTENAEGGHRNRRQKSFVNPETASYLEDVVAHFKTLVDDEERALLVGNVLEEISGKEVKVAGDPACSRQVETLMAAAQVQHLVKFLTSVSDVDGFFTLVSSPFGSHVVEKLLVRLEAQLDVMTQDEYDEFQRVMTLLTDSICPHLYDYVTDRFATHVVRRLLCLLAGRNVLPPPSKQQQQQQLPGLENKRSKSEAPSGLAAKLGGGGGSGGGKRHTVGAAAAATLAAELLGTDPDEPPPCRLPDLVSRFTTTICSDDYAGAVVSELVYHPYACPFLQALLRAAASDRKALRQLVPVLLGATSFNDSVKGGGGAVLEGCRDEEVAAMVVDPTTSHLVEVLLQVLPKSLLEEFFRRFLSPRLPELAHHPSANFVVQAALAAAPSKEMAKAMYDSLSGLLPDLLRKRRSGVVAALVACCGRHAVCQKEVCAALAGALSGLPQWAGIKGDAALAPALLCLDSAPVVGANEPYGAAAVAAGARSGGGGLPRLSAVGCSILIQVLRYGQGACRAFTDSVAALRPHDAARVGADPSGSRVLEALLEGNAPAKVKGTLLTAMAEHWDAVATTASGSFLVETAYRWADLVAKEAIVLRLASATKALESTHWGPALLRKVGAEAYSRDPEQWRRHAASASKTLDQFTRLFGGESSFEDRATGEEKGKKKKSKLTDGNFVEKRGEGDGKRGKGGKVAKRSEEVEDGGGKEMGKGKRKQAGEGGDDEEAWRGDATALAADFAAAGAGVAESGERVLSAGEGRRVKKAAKKARLGGSEAEAAAGEVQPQQPEAGSEEVPEKAKKIKGKAAKPDAE